MLGHYLMHHYAAEWSNVELIGSEVGENIDSIQAHFAFTRGAARQFRKPWFIDFSDWNDGTYHNYKMNATTRQYDRANNGHSISLRERVAYLSYMSGANKHMVEDPAFFYDNNETAADGFLPLSPVGSSVQTTHAFFAAHPDRGVPYTPVALMLDSMHGMGLGWWNIAFKNGSRSVFDAIPGQPNGPFGMAPTLPYTEQDNYTTLFFNTLWPEALPMNVGPNAHDESKRLVPSKYPELWDVLVDDSVSTAGYGEPTFDVSLLGAGCPECGGYRAVFLLGNIDFNATRATLPTYDGQVDMSQALHLYASTGGTIVSTAPVVFEPGNNFSSWPEVGDDAANPTPRVQVNVSGTQLPDGTWVRRGCGGSTQAPSCTFETFEPFFANTTSAVLLYLVTVEGKRLPAVVSTNVGSGKLVTVVPPVARDLDDVGILDWVLDNVTDAVTPFKVEGGQVQLLLNRRPAGWNITFVNNLGITKECNWQKTPACTPDLVDPTKAQTVKVTLKPEYAELMGVLSGVAEEHVTSTPVTILGNVSFTVTIPSGAVRIVGVEHVQP